MSIPVNTLECYENLYLHIHYALRCRWVYWYHFLLHVQHLNGFYTQYVNKHLPLSGISKWILRHKLLNLTQYLFFFGEAGSELSAIFLAVIYWFYSVMVGESV